MAFKQMMTAQGKWQKLNGANRMPEIIQGIAFMHGTKTNANRRLINPSPTFGHSSARLQA